MRLDCESETERLAYLDRACDGDPELRAEVETLLRAHEQAGGFLEPLAEVPAADGARAEATDTDVPGLNPEVGTVLAGRYKLLEVIGEGGMGTVWRAEQTEPVRRKVALKVIKPGMDSKQVLARFEAERQALALMDHPNIAKVLDGGTTRTGRPYFVMELVKGMPITEYCDQQRLTPARSGSSCSSRSARRCSTPTRKGIIHRDLKPTNVLVAECDGKPVPKVIDFGIAKAMGQPLTDKTLFTGLGGVVGTPEYMSPEQAELNNIDIDTRADIYALGVLLYELLTGTTPLSRDSVRRRRRYWKCFAWCARRSRRSRARDCHGVGRPADRRRESRTGAEEAERPGSRRTRLDRDEGAGEGPYAPLRHGRGVRRRRAMLPRRGARARPSADETATGCGSSSRRHRTGSRWPSVVAVALLSDRRRPGREHHHHRSETADHRDRFERRDGRPRRNSQKTVERERKNLYDYAFGMARRDWMAGDIDQARRNLEDCPPELRDREWEYLHRVCHAELRRRSRCGEEVPILVLMESSCWRIAATRNAVGCEPAANCSATLRCALYSDSVRPSLMRYSVSDGNDWIIPPRTANESLDLSGLSKGKRPVEHPGFLVQGVGSERNSSPADSAARETFGEAVLGPDGKQRRCSLICPIQPKAVVRGPEIGRIYETRTGRELCTARACRKTRRSMHGFP